MGRAAAIASGAFAIVVMMTLMLVASGPGHFEYIATAAIAVVVTGYLLYALLRAEEL